MCFVQLKSMALLMGSAGCVGKWDLCTLLKRLMKEYGQIHCLPKLRGLREADFHPFFGARDGVFNTVFCQQMTTC